MQARVFPITWLDGAPRLAMVAKRVYRLTGSRLTPAEIPCPLAELPEVAPSPEPAGFDRLVAETDFFAPLKSSTDVMVRGAAWSVRGPARMLDTHVQVGPLRKSVRAWGRRCIHLDLAGRARFSEPEPLESMPLSWEHAYGGRDIFAEEKLRPKKRGWSRGEEEYAGAIAYPRNPLGRGFFLDLERDRLEGAPAPSLEDPVDPVTPDRLLARDALDWPDRPAAACYELVDRWTFPRVAFWLGALRGPSIRPLYEVRHGALREVDLQDRPLGGPPDPRAYSCAPVGLSGARLCGKERVSLRGLHPQQELLELELPAERPRLLLEPPGCGAMELPPLLQTVLLEPDQERVTMTWSGTLEVAAPYSEEMCREMRRAVQWTR